MIEPTQEQQNQICADLARAMGYLAVKDGTYFYLLDAQGSREEDADGYPIASTCEEGVWMSAPNPFTSAADSRALVEWLSSQGQATQLGFSYCLYDLIVESGQPILAPAVYWLTAKFPVIALAAHRAIGFEVKE